jgi:hypothetical protein
VLSNLCFVFRNHSVAFDERSIAFGNHDSLPGNHRLEHFQSIPHFEEQHGDCETQTGDPKTGLRGSRFRPEQQAIKPLSHIGGLNRQKHASRARKTQHDPTSPRSTLATPVRLFIHTPTMIRHGSELLTEGNQISSA